MFLPHTGVLLQHSFAVAALMYVASTVIAQTSQCAATSSANITPVTELCMSEGCSSCPPADKRASTFKEKAANGEIVVQAFHVGY